jgi:hypothetical protein
VLVQEVQAAACCALRNLSLSPLGQRQFVKMYGLYPLLRAMERHMSNASLQAHCCYLVSNVAESTDNIPEMVRALRA